MSRLFFWWLAAAFFITLLMGLTYLGTQQVLRQNADEPQLALANEIALNQGDFGKLTAQLPDINVEQSLLPFVVIYNEAQQPTNGTGKLNGSLPTPPLGVLDAAKAKGENRLTWQPTSTTRLATVVRHYNGGYVLVARSLKTTEAIVNMIGLTTAIGEVTLLLAAAILGYYLQRGSASR